MPASWDLTLGTLTPSMWGNWVQIRPKGATGFTDEGPRGVCLASNCDLWYSLERGWINSWIVNHFLNKIKTLAMAATKERERLMKIKYLKVG